MHAVLDANIIIAEGFGSSLQFRVLLSTLSASQHNLYVPKLVIEEVVARFERVFDRENKRVTDGLEALSRHLGKDLPSPIDALDKRDESDLFRHRLEAQFDIPHCTILDYPDIAHEELVKRAAHRIRPFNESGSGYRDTLVWENVLNIAVRVSSEVVLLSNDNDFRNEQGELHDDLASRLVSRGLPRNKVILIRSVRDFNNAYEPTTLQGVYEE